MTQEEWNLSTDPVKLLWFVKGRTIDRISADRKLRHIALAFCRRVVHLLKCDEWQQPVAIAEQCADGLLPPENMKEWHGKAVLTGYAIGNAPAPWTAELYALGAVGDVVHPDSYQAAINTQWLAQYALHPEETTPGGEPKGTKEDFFHADIIRDIIGNPFRTTSLNSSCFTRDAVALARRMYDTRDFGAMPILADALEAAGCDDVEILNHCRRPGLHVRGCWALDLVLGKQ